MSGPGGQGLRTTVREVVEDTWRCFSWKGAVHWSWKTGEGYIAGGRSRSKESLTAIIEAAENAHANLYLTLNATTTYKARPRREDIEAWRYILLDFDPTPEYTDVLTILARGFIKQAERMVSEVLSSPVSEQDFIMVNSGRGVQLWLYMHTTPTQGRASSIERGTAAFLRRLGTTWGSTLGLRLDSRCSDLPRLVRCPGSINWKTSRRAAFIWLPQYPGGIHPHFITDMAPPPERVERPKVVESLNLRDLRPHLTYTARRFLRHGAYESGTAPAGELDGRHHACYTAAIGLLELGIPAEDAMALLCMGAERCVPRLQGREVLAALTQAQRRLNDRSSQDIHRD